ncbi:MAG: GNAT family N-acetyltransferase [Clostridiales bacterium]|nr:GNAT family N-acetyltransferase [Clostridiales bacterium]
MLTIRNLTLQEMVFLMEVAFKEGWNPGLYDGAAFFQTDPDGFFIAEREGGLIGGISVVKYGEERAFLGNHFVLPPFRGKGYGKELWEYALAQAGNRIIGVNGLTEGKQFYESYGFRSIGNIIRYQGSIFPKGRLSDDIYSSQDIDFYKLLAFDAGFFGIARERFLRAWLETPALESLCVLKGGEIKGWGCMRRCRNGWRLGPVFASEYAIAEELLRHFAIKTIAEEVSMDVPESNVQAIRLAFSMGMTPVDARLRAYKGEQIREPLEQIFGFTTLDIG